MPCVSRHADLLCKPTIKVTDTANSTDVCPGIVFHEGIGLLIKSKELSSFVLTLHRDAGKAQLAGNANFPGVKAEAVPKVRQASTSGLLRSKQNVCKSQRPSCGLPTHLHLTSPSFLFPSLLRSCCTPSDPSCIELQEHCPQHKLQQQPCRRGQGFSWDRPSSSIPAHSRSDSRRRDGQGCEGATSCSRRRGES